MRPLCFLSQVRRPRYDRCHTPPLAACPAHCLVAEQAVHEAAQSAVEDQRRYANAHSVITSVRDTPRILDAGVRRAL